MDAFWWLLVLITTPLWLPWAFIFVAYTALLVVAPFVLIIEAWKGR